MVEGGVCVGCMTGSLHEGSPKGKVDQVADLRTYIAEPPSNKDKTPGIIVIIPDIFGWELVNSRLLADDYAEKSGKTVYLPDFMFGDIPDAKLNDMLHPIDGTNPGFITKALAFTKAFMRIAPWFYRHRQAVTIPIVKSFFTKLRELHPDTKIGVAGFCWGGRYAILLGQTHFNETKLVDAVFAGHPSLVSIPADVLNPQVPVSIAVASTDGVFSPAMAAKTEKLWVGDDVDYEFEIYEGAKHGFCVRGNMKNEKEKENMMKATEQAVNWFHKYLK